MQVYRAEMEMKQKTLYMLGHKKDRYPVILMESVKRACNKCVHWFVLENMCTSRHVQMLFPHCYAKCSAVGMTVDTCLNFYVGKLRDILLQYKKHCSFKFVHIYHYKVVFSNGPRKKLHFYV